MPETTLPFLIEQRTDRVSETDRIAAMQAPKFGTVFTDHMAVLRWSRADGWHDAKITARKPIELDPSASVLHYAQEIFEGMKAYRGEDSILLFRPEQNAQRFNASATRLAMPTMPPELFLAAVSNLVRTDERWVPDGDGSLYIRPFMFASEAFLGVRPAEEYMFLVIASPVGPYFKGGSLKLWVSESYTRAAPGGTGAAKCGGNYASSLVAQAEATEHGCDQVVFLDAIEHRWIEELGGMNVFFVFEDGRLLTPELSGTILPGITRDCILALAGEMGLSPTEGRYSLEDWRADAQSGRVREAFACGTAAVVASIGEIRGRTTVFTIGTGTEGPITRAIRERLTGIQRGRLPDEHGWVRSVV